MTLYKLLRGQEAKYLSEAYTYFSNDKEFYKCIGRSDACRNLIDLLSDDALKTEIITRAEAINGERGTK